jgi:N-acetylglucosaminyldiphosphoundecaprenol N-acetyl-beta-D-mannosaminyltransferase
MMGYFDKSYRDITNASTFSVPDGQPIRWAMGLLGRYQQERVRGPSLMRAICDKGREVQLRHYLYGASPETLFALEKKLKELYPGIIIAGVESPPYRVATESETRATIARIHETNAHVVWVGLGAPKQERWMWARRNEIQPMMFGIGAAFDLLAERIPEAPAWMQAIGCEWLYRFMREPKRLWRRYVIYNPLFVALIAWELLLRLVFGKKGSSWN